VWQVAGLARPAARTASWKAFGQVLPQISLERNRQHGHPVLGSLAVANSDLTVGEVDVLHAQAKRFHQAHSGAVKEREEGPVSRFQAREDALDLLRRQHHRELPPPLRADEPFELPHLAGETPYPRATVNPRCRSKGSYPSEACSSAYPWSMQKVAKRRWAVRTGRLRDWRVW
jgi:hypothetical protein